MQFNSYVAENTVKSKAHIGKKISASFVSVTSSNFWKLCLLVYTFSNNLYGALIIYCEKRRKNGVQFGFCSPYILTLPENAQK